MNEGKMIRLMVMMFVQNMLFPVWFNTIGPYVGTLPDGDTWIPFCSSLMGIGMFASPIVCMVADRFLDSGRVLALCNILSAGALSLSAFMGDPALLFPCLVAATLFQMPTWSIAAAIAMAHAPTRSFPYIRACGSIGWAGSALISFVAIKCFGVTEFETSNCILWAGAAVAAVGAAVALLMPPTPPKAKGTPLSVVDALGLRALVLLKNREFCVLSCVLLLAMVPFQWYMGYCSIYLKEVGFSYLSLTQNLGQVAELGFMLVLPLLFAKLSFRSIMLLGLGALAFRYACFGAAAISGCHVLDFGGILIHGLIFGIVIVGVQMHAAEIAPPELRNQVQGYVMTVSAGVGSFLSVAVFHSILSGCTRPEGGHDWSVPYLVAFGLAVLAMALFAVFYKGRSDHASR